MTESQLQALAQFLEDEREYEETQRYLRTPVGEAWFAQFARTMRKTTGVIVDVDLEI